MKFSSSDDHCALRNGAFGIPGDGNMRGSRRKQQLHETMICKRRTHYLDARYGVWKATDKVCVSHKLNWFGRRRPWVRVLKEDLVHGVCIP